MRIEAVSDIIHCRRLGGSAKASATEQRNFLV